MRVVKKGKSSVTKPNLILRIPKLTLEKGTPYLDDFRLKFILLILVLRMPAVWSGYSLNIHKRRSKAIQKKTWSNGPKCCWSVFNHLF